MVNVAILVDGPRSVDHQIHGPTAIGLYVCGRKPGLTSTSLAQLWRVPWDGDQTPIVQSPWSFSNRILHIHFEETAKVTGPWQMWHRRGRMRAIVEDLKGIHV